MNRNAWLQGSPKPMFYPTWCGHKDGSRVMWLPNRDKVFILRHDGEDWRLDEDNGERGPILKKDKDMSEQGKLDWVLADE